MRCSRGAHALLTWRSRSVQALLTRCSNSFLHVLPPSQILVNSRQNVTMSPPNLSSTSGAAFISFPLAYQIFQALILFAQNVNFFTWLLCTVFLNLLYQWFHSLIQWLEANTTSDVSTDLLIFINMHSATFHLVLTLPMNFFSPNIFVSYLQFVISWYLSRLTYWRNWPFLHLLLLSQYVLSFQSFTTLTCTAWDVWVECMKHLDITYVAGVIFAPLHSITNWYPCPILTNVFQMVHNSRIYVYIHSQLVSNTLSHLFGRRISLSVS